MLETIHQARGSASSAHYRRPPKPAKSLAWRAPKEALREFAVPVAGLANTDPHCRVVVKRRLVALCAAVGPLLPAFFACTCIAAPFVPPSCPRGWEVGLDGQPASLGISWSAHSRLPASFFARPPSAVISEL